MAGGYGYESRRAARQRKKAAFAALREQVSPLVQQGDQISIERARQITQRYARENSDKPEPPAFMRKIGEMARAGLEQRMNTQNTALADAPPEIAAAADREAAGIRGVQSFTPSEPQKRPGVPRGVAEAFPEEAVDRKVYDVTKGEGGGTSLPSVNLTGSLLDNPEGLPGPLQGALDVPVVGQTLREVARPANYVPAGKGTFLKNLGQNVIASLGAQGASTLAENNIPEDAPGVVKVGAPIVAGIAGAVAGGGAFAAAENAPSFLGRIGQSVKASMGDDSLARVPSISGATSPLIPSAVQAQPGSALGAAAQQAAGQGPKATLPAGIARALDQARNVTKADRPGAAAQAFYKVPGMKSLLRPGLDMPDNVIESYVAEGAARAEFGQQAFASRRQVFNQLDQAFGQNATDGSTIGVRFLGTADEAKYPGTGTLYDVLQRPEKYDLSPAQRTLVQSFDARNEGLRQNVVEDFGAEIGRFQREQGGAYLPNVDRSEAAQDIAEAIGQSERSAAASGRAKTRFYDTGYDRWRADQDAVTKGRLQPAQVFTPETNVRQLIEGMDSSKERMVGSQVFRAGLGGKTKLEVLQETHPELYNRMTGLRTRLQSLRGTAGRLDEKLDGTIETFLGSPMNDTDVDSLIANMQPQSVRGSVAGMTERQIRAEISKTRQAIVDLNPSWKAANPRGYQFVGDGIYRYFPADQIGQIKGLLKTDSSPIFRTIANINAGVLSGDLSPLVGQQGQVAWLTSPIQTSKAVFGGMARGAREGDILRGFKADALADDITKDPASWGDFAFYTGRSTTPGSVPEEFAGGWIGKVPGVGKKFTDANDAVYTAVIRAQKRMWDEGVGDLVNRGVDPQRARAISGRNVMGVIPTPNRRTAGISASQASGLRAPLTSLTFVQRPAQMIAEATEGLANLAIPGRSMTEAQRLAVKSVVRMNATALTLAASTAAINAQANGQDPMEAAIDAVNPMSKQFMKLTFPGGATVPLGGPYRAIFKALAPKPTKIAGGEEVLLPFGGAWDYLRNRVSPAVRRPIDLARNKDFYGTKIMYGDFPMNILRAAEYEIEGLVPLSAGGVAEGIRKGADVGDIATGAIGSVLGSSVSLPSPTDRLNSEAQRAYKRDFYDLTLEERGNLLTANPHLAQQLSESKSKRDTDSGQWARAKIDSTARVDALNTQLMDGTLTREQWRDAVDTESKMLRGEARRIFGTDREIPSAQEQARDPAMKYLAVMSEFTDKKTGIVNETAFQNALSTRMTSTEIEAAFRGFGADDQPLQKLRSKAAREYYAIPRYRGFTAEQGQAIDRAWDQVLAIAGNTDNRLKKLQALRKIEISDPKVKQALYRRVYGTGLTQDKRREQWASRHPEARPLLGLGRGVVTEQEQQALSSALGST